MSSPTSDVARSALIGRAEKLVKEQMAKYDPSHDWAHAMKIASTLDGVDLLVIELAALFHDLADAKYTTSDTPTLPQLLQPIFSPDPSTLGFSSEESSVLSPSQIDLIYRIIPSVSWSKEKALRAESEQRKLSTVSNGITEFSQTTSVSSSGSSSNSNSNANAGREVGWTKWHKTCLELHAVQDADRLDAIGAVGIFRVAAFSGAKGRCLVGKGKEAGDTAEQHFYDKLLKVKDRMKTDWGRQEAEKRQQTMLDFLAALDREHLVWAD